ncbi:MAG: RNA polymerase sigma-70 factor [Bacteroidales bacterium]|nr:RNA polymerase sigma-70 factor [Bacteroidales bacterium]
MDSSKTKELSDAEWNERFQSIYQQYYAKLCIYATSILANDEESEEIVQNVIYKLWEQREKFNEIENLQSYLYRSVKNLCINIINRQKIEDKYKSEAWFELKNIELHAIEPLENNNQEQEKKLYEAIEQLPERCKEVLLLSKFQGMKNKEIAEHLDVSVKAIEASITRAFTLLRKMMNNPKNT